MQASAVAAAGDISDCLLEEDPHNWYWSPVGSVYGLLKSTAVLPC
jgi:hypothetical protein